ncbi:putative gamma-tubulin complex component 6 [Apostichopus japonicus]|uniref:Gamma-tubulin complex component n=1 Tax=Stichopus japonicus TaxID=307972 RepID=A0A2G8JWC7_STIJA|nr:putative gamma-tubulin complex component 6 [Apostichopus japonicus]
MNPADKDYVVPRNLFGAMVQSSISSVHTKLSLPKLPSATSNPELLGLRLPAAMSSPDEGFGSMTSSRSSSVISSPTEKHPWTAALNFTVCKHRTWEILGQPGHKTERPYLTESGPGVFDQIYDVRCNQARMVANEYPVQVTIFKDEKQPCRDAIYALLGLPSETFQFDKKLLTFSSNRNCRLTGTSVESFQSMIQFFTDAATDYVRLQYITQPQFMDSFYHNGLVLQAFLGSVRKFLNFYQISVMKAVSDDNSALTLLKMRVVFSKLVSLLRTLASICGCDERQGTRPGDGGDQLCTGIKLISYLYRSCLDCISREEYLILLSLLRDACGPYLMFIQDWSFHGICGDLYQEFMIEVDNEHIYKRDKYYWTHGYKLRALEDEARVPFFMGSIATDIFNCGKSINLMKLCCPEHFICNVDMAVPRIIITFSSKELEESHFKTAEYSKQMTILSRQKTISRKQKAASEEKAKEENAIRAHRQAAKEMERIQNNILKVRLEADAKKRKIFQELKEQMQQELLRKASEGEAEKKEDKARMDVLTGQEADETDLQTELEIKARKLIAYYEELSEDARKRERKALWKVRRRNLDQSRKEFLATEEDRLDLEQTEKLANSERQDNEEFSSLKTGANSHLDKEDSISKLKINTSSEPVTFVPVHEQNHSGESQPITLDVGHIGGSSKVGRDSDVGHIGDNIKVSEDGDRKHLNPTNVTFLANEDIESTLNLIGSEDSSLLHGGQTVTDVPVDIRDHAKEDKGGGGG